MTLKNSRNRSGYEPGDTIKFGSIVFQYTRSTTNDSFVLKECPEGMANVTRRYTRLIANDSFVLKECPEGMAHITRIQLIDGNWWCGVHPGNTPWHAYLAATTLMQRITQDDVGQAERDLRDAKQRLTSLSLVLAIIEAQEEGEAV